MIKKNNTKGDSDLPAGLNDHFSRRLKEALNEKEIAGFERNLRRSLAGTRQMQNRIYVGAAALLLLLASTVATHFFGPETKRFFHEYYAPYPSEHITGIYRDDRTDKNVAVIYYTEGKFDKALPLLQDYLEGQPDDIQISLLLAICMIEEKRFAHAREIFGNIIRSGNYYFKADAHWYSALCYIYEGDYPSAGQLLMQLAGSEIYRSKAEALLKKITRK